MAVPESSGRNQTAVCHYGNGFRASGTSHLWSLQLFLWRWYNEYDEKSSRSQTGHASRSPILCTIDRWRLRSFEWRYIWWHTGQICWMYCREKQRKGESLERVHFLWFAVSFIYLFIFLHCCSFYVLDLHKIPRKRMLDKAQTNYAHRCIYFIHKIVTNIDAFTFYKKSSRH